MGFLRFVHTADLHLDSPFRGIQEGAPDHVARRLVQATFEAYERVIDVCIEREVEALLVAGDIYDGADRSLRAQLAFVDGLKRLDAVGIRSFVCHGNHDPLNGWQARLRFPASCHQFGGEVAAVPFDPADPERGTVVGVSYPTQKVLENLAPAFGRVPRQGFSIGLLHCNVGNNPEHAAYAPCTLDDLRTAGIDYWALGHVHTRQVLSEHRPTVVYPGNTQGRHPNETGPRGVYVVEAHEAGAPQLEFVATAAVRWETLAVDIAGFEAEQRLLDVIEAGVGELAGAAREDVVYRLKLTGRGPLHEAVRRADFGETVRERLNQTWAEGERFAWCERVEVATAPALDREALRTGADFVADLLRLFDETRAQGADPPWAAGALAPLYGNPRFLRALGEDKDARPAIAELLEAAEEICLEELQ